MSKLVESKAPLRFCGTVFMPSVYADEETFMKFFEKNHPRLCLASSMLVLQPHSPEGFPPLRQDNPVIHSCLDVWVLCKEDDPGNKAALPEKVITAWRQKTEVIRRDDLSPGVMPSHRRRLRA